MGLPEVFGELLGGIVVGPSLLGIVHGESETIRVMAELGMFFLMMHTGLKIDAKELLSAWGASLLITVIGTLAPFGAVYAVARAFGYAPLSALFSALILSVSALPLVARMFKDAKRPDSPAAHASIGAAIVGDVLALVAFSLLLSMTEQRADPASAAKIVLYVAVFFAGVVAAGLAFQRYLPLVLRYGNRSFTLSLILALCIGLLAEWAGLHMIIGAFLAGLFIKEEIIDPQVFARIEDRYYGLTYGFFAPVFFASLAFRFEPEALLAAPWVTGALAAAALVGKGLGSAAGALGAGLSRQEALLSGVAMNARGGVELVIASVALEAGVIDGTAFSVLVAVTFLSTIVSLLAMPAAARMTALPAQAASA